MIVGRVHYVRLGLIRVVGRLRSRMVRLVTWLGDILWLGRVASISSSISSERRGQESESRNRPKECGVHRDVYRMREVVEKKLLTRLPMLRSCVGNIGLL
jgi:hypothetical protein